MKCFVTGASGFVGANIARELVEAGHEVRALLRPGCDRSALRGVEVEIVEGGLDDRDALARAMRGCDWCFHVAADYRLWVRDCGPMYAANVEGTRNIILAAAKAQCSRVIYTSTVGCMGLPCRVSGRYAPTDESTYADKNMFAGNHYKLSKLAAERVALDYAMLGHPVIIVNPSAPIGPRDAKPTPTGKVIVDFLNRRMPAYLDTGLNWVHVRDVAAGHLLAASKGRVGERYILGNRDGNLSLKDAFATLERITGVKAPRFRVPYGIAWAAGQVGEVVSSMTGKPPRAPIAAVRMAAHRMYFDPSKAITELGLPQTPVDSAFADAVQWYLQNGYVSPSGAGPEYARAV